MTQRADEGIYLSKSHRANPAAASPNDEVAANRSMKRGPLKITVVRDRRYIRMPNFTKRQVDILKEWLLENLDNPYPGSREKEYLSQKSGLCRK